MELNRRAFMVSLGAFAVVPFAPAPAQGIVLEFLKDDGVWTPIPPINDSLECGGYLVPEQFRKDLMDTIEFHPIHFNCRCDAMPHATGTAI